MASLIHFRPAFLSNRRGSRSLRINHSCFFVLGLGLGVCFIRRKDRLQLVTLIAIHLLHRLAPYLPIFLSPPLHYPLREDASVSHATIVLISDAVFCRAPEIASCSQVQPGRKSLLAYYFTMARMTSHAGSWQYLPAIESNLSGSISSIWACRCGADNVASGKAVSNEDGRRMQGAMQGVLRSARRGAYGGDLIGPPNQNPLSVQYIYTIATPATVHPGRSICFLSFAL